MILKLAAILKQSLIAVEMAKCAFPWNAFATAKTTAEIGPTNLRAFVASMSAVKASRLAEVVTNNVSTCPLATNVPVNRVTILLEMLRAKVSRFSESTKKIRKTFTLILINKQWVEREGYIS